MITQSDRVAGHRGWKQERRSGQGKLLRRLCFVCPLVIQVLGEVIVKNDQILIISWVQLTSWQRISHDHLPDQQERGQLWHACACA